MLKFLGFVIVYSNSEKEERGFDRSQKSVKRKYGDHIAADHLSLQWKKAIFTVFWDRTGAGKSTTMNMITGYIGPTEGSIMINGHDMLENPEEAKNVLVICRRSRLCSRQIFTP